MNYDQFQDVMGTWPQYLWEPIEVQTDDGYILTMFHVWNQEKRDAANKGPILFQHGNGYDAATWLKGMTWGHASYLQLADQGHDLYFGNNRGTKYSSTHVQYDWISDAKDYWDFTWADMEWDVLANVQAMYENAGNDLKGYYFGYSKGSTQMMVALMHHEDTLDQYLERVVFIGPCTIVWGTDEVDLSEKAMNKVSEYRDAGVYAFHGPTYDEDIEVICEFVNRLKCRYFKNRGLESFSMKDREHFTQNQRVNKF